MLLSIGYIQFFSSYYNIGSLVDYQRALYCFEDFLNCYLDVPKPTLGHYQRDRLNYLMLIPVAVT